MLSIDTKYKFTKHVLLSVYDECVMSAGPMAPYRMEVEICRRTGDHVENIDSNNGKV